MHLTPLEFEKLQFHIRILSCKTSHDDNCTLLKAPGGQFVSTAVMLH